VIRLAKGLFSFCVLGLAVLTIGTPAVASTVTVNFAGTLTGILGGNPLGGSVNQAISGSLSFGPVVGPINIPNPTTIVANYFSSNTAWTFSLGGASGGGLTTLTLYKESTPPTANFGADFFVDGTITGHPGRSLDLWTRANGADPTIPPLTLATIPATLGDWATVFAVAILSTGSLTYDGGTYKFDLTQVDVATTPLPASSLLFVSALVGLGVTGWRRGREVPALSI
jgi:hypothetical protein